MAWGKLEATFRDHRKPKRLARALDISTAHARGLVAGLWSWCHGNAPDGNLMDMDDDEIEEAADWDGPPGAMVRAMSDERVGLLDLTTAGYIVHGFEDMQGSYLESRKRYERRKREARPKTDCPRTSPGQSADGPRLEKRREEKIRLDEIREEEITSLASVADFQKLVTDNRWTVAGLSPTTIVRCERLVAGGPIEPHEIENALSVCDSRGVTSPEFFLGVVERTRRDCEKERARGSPGAAKKRKSLEEIGHEWAVESNADQ